MRLKFQDVECYRDYQYEYSDYDNLPNKEFNVWNPLSLETIKENEEKKPNDVKNVEIDPYTEMYANELGLRSLKQQSNNSDVDQLDLSFLDYEVVDVSNETQSNLTKRKNETSTGEIHELNDTSRPDRRRTDGQNVTSVELLDQPISKNTTAMQNSSIFLNHSVNKKVNILPTTNQSQNGSRATNDSSSGRITGLEAAVISKPENLTAVLLKNGSATTNVPISNSNILFRKKPSNGTLSSSIPSLSTNEIVTNSPEVFNDSESSEEVFIFVKDKNTGLIKTTSVKTSGHNWTYDGTHQIVPAEIPDDIKKYTEKSPAPKKKVNLRHRPQKGRGMKTKRKKEYKPQPRSGLPLSPRGFNPLMSPRGARPQGLQPVNDEENLINKPVVIGVPRPDFSDYELYLPGDEPDHLGVDEQNVKANEYEYVSYKDPYSSNEDAKNFNLDQTTKYLENVDKNVRTYFIAAEEVQWDYAGYGRR